MFYMFRIRGLHGMNLFFVQYRVPFHASTNVFIPAMLTYVAYKICSRVMEVVSRQFKFLKEYSELIALFAGAGLSSFLVKRLASTLSLNNPVLAGMAMVINTIAITVIGTVQALENYKLKASARAEAQAQARGAPARLSFVTDMMTSEKINSYAVLGGRDDAIKGIERALNRPAGSQSVVLIGEQSSQPELIAEECARRIAQGVFSPEKKVHSINTSIFAGITTTNLQEELDILSQKGNVILVMNQIGLLARDDLSWSCQILGDYVRSGKISIIGITSPGQYSQVQSLPFASRLTPIQITPTQAKDCFSAMQAKNQKRYFTQNTPNATVSEDALALATLFAYHHVVKGFVLKDAAVLLCDIIFSIGNFAKSIVLTKELFLQHWREIYLQDPTKIFLASLDQASRDFFAQKGLDVIWCVDLVAELNKQKKNAQFSPDMPPFLSDMNEVAREGGYPPCIGREKEIRELIRALRQPKNNSRVLSGEPGIGKTAIFEEIARKIVVKDPSVKALWDTTLYWVNVTALTGTDSYVGRIQKAVASMIDFSKERGGKAILVIDELHQLRGAGRYQGNNTDILEMVKNSLARDEIIVFGSTNGYMWDPIVREDPAVERRIKSIHIEPPSSADCVRMLQSTNANGFYTRGYEPVHVEVSSDAVRAAVYLTQKWMQKKFLPDKATVLISEAVAFCQDEEERARGLAGANQPKKEITPIEIAGRLFQSIKHDLNKEGYVEETFMECLKTANFYIPTDVDDKKGQSGN